MMNEVVAIKPYAKKNSTLIINEQLAQGLGLSGKRRESVSFGRRSSYVGISISRRIDYEEIFLSSNVIADLHIPDFIISEACVRKNEIKIGPCIGILASQRDKDITKRRLKEIFLNILDYNTIHGAIIAFALDKVNTSEHVVEGYCYNHQKDSWERGIFPYPSAIYNRTSLNEKWQNHFLSVIGDRVFNNYHFNKWEMHQWFSSEDDILPHLPYTKLYEGSKDLYNMLQKYERVYVKPIWGMKGFGVAQVSLKNDKLLCRYREDDENREVYIDNSKDGEKVLASLFKPGEHIIQQGLELLKFKGGVVDFRVVMQKNSSCHWVCNSIVSRIGAKESVVSNISSGGMALPAVDVLKEGLELSEAEAFVLKEKMIGLCMNICRTLDGYGINYGTLGLDLGLDKHGEIWLIEVNNRRPHPAIALRVNDLQAYYTILASPMYYAKALSGF